MNQYEWIGQQIGRLYAACLALFLWNVALTVALMGGAA